MSTAMEEKLRAITRRSLFAVLAGGAAARTFPALAVTADPYEVTREYWVMLKSGGPRMSVSEIRSDGYVSCQWVGDDGWECGAWFHRLCLRGCP